jgi:hypothetical protein
MSARKAERAGAAACAQHADHAGAADALVHLYPGIAQRLGNAGGGAGFGKAELGMCVDITPEGDERRDQICDVVQIPTPRTGSGSGNGA